MTIEAWKAQETAGELELEVPEAEHLKRLDMGAGLVEVVEDRPEVVAVGDHAGEVVIDHGAGEVVIDHGVHVDVEVDLHVDRPNG